MTRSLTAAAALLVILAASHGKIEAAGTGCLPPPLPTTTTPPTFSRDVQSFSDRMHLDVWRLPCPTGGVIMLMRVTPITSGPFLCSLDFAIIQSASQFAIHLTDQSETFAFCGSLFVARTFYLSPNGSAYDPQQAFTLLYDTGNGTPRFAPLEIPAAGPQPPPPPSLVIIATGCTTCHSGQTVGYRIDVTNPGAAFSAELKGGAKLPDGSLIPLVDQRSTIPPGASSVTLVPTQALPTPLPTADVTIEAAILEPVFGTTIARTTTTLRVLP